ncbi:MAG: hypothetical protein ACFFDS_06535 [Candidatus Thorarchaeota archaeon]
MTILVEEYKKETERNKRIAITTLAIILICSIIVTLGAIYNIKDLYTFFSIITGLSLLFLLLVFAERKEIKKNFNNNDRD